MNLAGAIDRHQLCPHQIASALPEGNTLPSSLHAAGPRPVLEALIAVADGADLDWTLENSARLPSSYYHIMGASHFQKPFLVKASTI